jgi:hypothetical protein
MEGTLSVSSIARIAEAEGVPARLRCGRLELRGVYTLEGRGHEEWVDVTGWTFRELMSWLGY